MRKPVPYILQHCLAYGVTVTLQSIRENWEAGRKSGYGGTTLVPALFGNDITETSLVQTVGELGMKTLLVGFNGGDGPSNLKLAEYQQALENLRPVARMIVALAEKDLCEPIMVGPVHCHHRQLLPMGYKETDLDRWFDCLQKLAEEFGIKVAIEFLNLSLIHISEPTRRM